VANQEWLSGKPLGAIGLLSQRDFAKLQKESAPSMKARVLLVASILTLCACKKPQVSPQGSATATPTPTPRVANQGTVYLLRRVAVATEHSLYGLAPGTELKVIEDRRGKLLVQTQGLQFVINQRDTTDDLDQRSKIITREEERDSIRRIAKTTRAQTEDQKFLAEENARRRSFAEAQIARLCSTIDSARREIAGLEVKRDESVSNGGEFHVATANEARSYGIAVGSDDSAENKARRARIAVLQAHIADCDRQIQILSDAIAGWE
jgi:hypothetical protein